MTSENPDFAVLHTNGQVEYGRRNVGESTNTALRSRVPDLATQGMGRLRAWFTDDFSALKPNPLADHVLSSVGYDHPTGWRGTVALTMEEDHTGECPPLSGDVRAALDELAGK